MEGVEVLEDGEAVKAFFAGSEALRAVVVAAGASSSGAKKAVAAARGVGVAAVGVLDASSDEGGDAACEVGAKAVPWIALGRGGIRRVELFASRRSVLEIF